MIGAMIQLLAPLRRDRRGVAALEFGLIVPAMLVLMFGCFELSYFLQANAKLVLATQELADLVASEDTVTSSSIADFCIGAQAAMAPLSATALSATIVSVTEIPGNPPTVDWQDNSCGGGTGSIANPTAAAQAIISNAAVPQNEVQSAIMVQVNYAYSAPFSFILPATIALTNQAFARPLNNDTVIHQ
jgi:Flp pilus assembly protein TadG